MRRTPTPTPTWRRSPRRLQTGPIISGRAAVWAPPSPTPSPRHCCPSRARRRVATTWGRSTGSRAASTTTRRTTTTCARCGSYSRGGCPASTPIGTRSHRPRRSTSTCGPCSSVTRPSPWDCCPRARSRCVRACSVRSSAARWPQRCRSTPLSCGRRRVSTRTSPSLSSTPARTMTTRASCSPHARATGPRR